MHVSCMNDMFSIIISYPFILNAINNFNPFKYNQMHYAQVALSIVFNLLDVLMICSNMLIMFVLIGMISVYVCLFNFRKQYA